MACCCGTAAWVARRLAASSRSISSRGARLGEQEALHLIAASKPQQHPLLLGLHAFDQHAQPERAAER